MYVLYLTTFDTFVDDDSRFFFLKYRLYVKSREDCEHNTPPPPFPSFCHKPLYLRLYITNEEKNMNIFLSVFHTFHTHTHSHSTSTTVSPFEGLEKAVVLQEARKFDDGDFVTRKPAQCRDILTKLLYLLYQNNRFTKEETTKVFFGCTKLFQSKNPNLRRMLYLFIKELAKATQADEVIIVIQSLVKDMNSNDFLHAANAIRVLSKIVDSSMITSLDRFFKQSIVHKNPVVNSAALVSGLHLMSQDPKNAEVVRRWLSEVNESVRNANDMVQYHGLCLLHRIRKHDTHALTKLVMLLSRSSNLTSPLALCQLVQYATQLLRKENVSQTNKRALMDFLDSCLRHKHEMVIYEAARAMCRLEDMSARDLSPAITVLSMFLSSPKSLLRFAAIRTWCLFFCCCKCRQTHHHSHTHIRYAK